MEGFTPSLGSLVMTEYLDVSVDIARRVGAGELG
jgi:hypothetical protein